MKKILLSFLVIVVLVIPNNYVIALKNGIETKVTEEKTPVSVEQVTNVQSLKSGYGADPVLYDDYLYTIKTADWGSGSNGELLKINKSTMEIENRVELIGKTGYTPFITAGDEQIFVPLSDGRVQAFDAKTLVSTWVSKTPEKVGEVASHLTYHDGYLYYGIGGYSANQGDLFICVSTKDEDISQQFETKELNWVYDQGQGYYWSEAVVINDCIAFSGYDGKVVLHDLKDDKVYDTLDLGIGKITNSLFYDQETNKLVAANTNGYIVTVDVDDHDLKENALKKSKQFNGQFSSSPVCYNGRIYIGGGAGISFTVLDLNTLEEIYSIDNIAGSCKPILSTAYASDDNHQEVQLYMINYAYDSNRQTHLYHITDNQLNKTANYQLLYTLDTSISSNYWNGNLIMDENAFYAYNGNGTIVKFGFDTNIQTEKDEQLIVNKLNKQIASLPTKDNASIKLDNQLQEILSVYSKLSDEYKQQVVEIDKVKELEKIVDEQEKLIKKLNEDIINELNIYYISKNDESIVNELISNYEKIHQINKDYVENYQDVLDAKNIIDQLKKNIIPAIVFENIFGEDIDYMVDGMLDSDLSYHISFNGTDLKNIQDFNYGINHDSKYSQIIKNVSPNAFILDFEFKGNFPGKINFETETTLTDGQYGLYYYDNENQKIEYVKEVEVIEGKTSMTLMEGHTYFISEKLDLNTVNNLIKTGDQVTVLLPIAGLLMGIMGIYFIKKKTNKMM